MTARGDREALATALRAVDGVTAVSIDDNANRMLVEELRDLRLRLEADEEDRPVEGPLSGQSYVITGTLENYTREQAKAALEALGA